MIKLIVFDLDGTLLDTIEDIANSANHALEMYDFPMHEIEDYRYMIGNGLNKLLEVALPIDSRNDDVISMLRVAFKSHYFSHSDDYTKPYQGITDLLKQLDSGGYVLAVASNKVHEATVELVNKFFPTINFLAVLGQRDGFPVKPNPAILESIIHAAGMDKKEVLYVGDSGVDVATAYNAKVKFCGVLWGFRPRKELEEIGATVFIDKPFELYDLLNKK